MDVLFVAVIALLFIGICGFLAPVGGEGERELFQHGQYPPVPLHHG